MVKIVLTACAALTLWASCAMAQETLAVGACAQDVKKLCAGIQPGEDRLRSCAREHIREFSGACLLSLAKLTEVGGDCRAHLNRECANVEVGEDRLESCVRGAVASLSDTCKNALAQAVPGAR
jgi:hypothetical protein